MKLVGRAQVQQPGLGRRDVSAPGRLFLTEVQTSGIQARAETELARQTMAVREGRMRELEARTQIIEQTSKLFTTVADVYANQTKRANTLQLQQLLVSDRQRNAETFTYMENAANIDLNDPTVPEPLRKFVTDYVKRTDPAGQRRTNVPTHEIARDFTASFLQETTEASLKALEGTNQQDVYLEKMSPQITGYTEAATELAVVRREEAIAAMGNTAFDDAVMTNDYEGMYETALENVRTGVWTEQEYSDRISEAVTDMAYSDLNIQINQASTTDELDLVEDSIYNTEIPLKPSQRTSLSNAVVSRRSALNTEYERRRTRNHSDALVMLTRGELQKEWVQDKLVNNGLTPAAGASLLKAIDDQLAERDLPPSNAVMVDQLTARISTLPYPRDGDDRSLAERAEQLRDEIIAKGTGVTLDKGYQPAEIRSDDMQRLLEELAQAENTARGKGSQEFAQAQRLMRTVTGYTDMLSGMDGTSPNRMAFASFEAALRQYMEFRGPDDPDPVTWVQQNANRFDPTNYRGNYDQRIRARFPRYAGLIGDDGVTNEVVRQMYQQATKDVRDGRIPESLRQELLVELEYKLNAIGVDDTEDMNLPPSARGDR